MADDFWQSVGAEEYQAIAKNARPARINKYGNVPTVVNGVRFASKLEARRYTELVLRQRAGEIGHLALQPRFPLVVEGIKVGTYVADFAYSEGDRLVVEDTKSKATATPVYRLKKRLMWALYGIKVREVYQ